MNIDVVATGSQTISVVQRGTTGAVVTTKTTNIESTNGAVPQNLWVGPNKPAFSGPGMWIQTGLGVDGQDFTIWFEDGK